VLLSVDLNRSYNRYGAEWAARLPGLRRLVEQVSQADGGIRSRDVDYSAGAQADTAELFLGGSPVPAKDWLGAPFYAYLDGLRAAAACDGGRMGTRYVLHMDSDMLYGGLAQGWVAEAVRLMKQRPEVLACTPLPGPPTPDDSLRSQTLAPDMSGGFHCSHLSTRVCLIDMERLLALAPLPLVGLDRGRRALAALEGHSAYQPLEATLTQAMSRASLLRVDFLGETPGMWSLHPPYHTPSFYARLPQIIEQVESGEVPDGQLGDHDLNSSMLDWGRARRPKWRRLLDHAQVVAGHSLREAASLGRGHRAPARW
jgi:hypothetical protein